MIETSTLGGPLIATLQYSVSVFSARFFVFHSVYLIRSHDPYPSDERGREVRRNKNEATRMHFLLCKGEKAIREPFRCSEVHPHSCTPRNVCYSDTPSWWHIPSPTSHPRSIHTEQPASTTVWSHDEGLVASPILHWVYDPIQTAIETRVTQELLALSSTEYTGGEGSTRETNGKKAALRSYSTDSSSNEPRSLFVTALQCDYLPLLLDLEHV